MTAKRSPIDSVWDFFCSLKLTVVTLILLAVTSIIGTVIQQNLSPQEYLRIYSESTYRILDALQFFDMYHSWWFLALMGMFSINLIACSIKRLPRVWKAVHQPVLVAEDSLYRTFSNFEEHLVKSSVDEVKGRLSAFLKQNFAEPVITEKDGKIHLFAQKGAYSRFGVYVTHLSILVIFLGAIIGNLWGYKAFVNIAEGTQENRVWPRGGSAPINLDFSLRCEDFSVTFYEGSNRPKEFKSILTVLENGQPVSEELTNRSVIVNDPLRYKGITFYQSSYGPTGDPLFDFRVKVRETGETVNLNARQGQRVSLPGGGSFRVVQFAQSYQNFGPAARIEVFPKDGKRSSFMVLQAFPDFDAQRGGDYIFSLRDFNQRFYTGLQVAKDPGVWVVWTGCFLLVAGCMIAFFLSHRRIWMTVQPVGGKTGIKFGGTAHRNQPGFELFIDDLKRKLKDELAA